MYLRYLRCNFPRLADLQTSGAAAEVGSQGSLDGFPVRRAITEGRGKRDAKSDLLVKIDVPSAKSRDLPSEQRIHGSLERRSSTSARVISDN
jgi:hypothetical protein